MHYKYYAIFDKTENPNGTYTVTFPDIKGAITEGTDLAKAQLRAKECLQAMAYSYAKDGDVLPNPSSLAQLSRKYPSKTIKLVEINLK